jgi:hypothetical protein
LKKKFSNRHVHDAVAEMASLAAYAGERDLTLPLSAEEEHLLRTATGRPRFPSGVSSRLGMTIASWFSQKDRELGVVLAGGDRLKRSGGS